MPYRIVRHLQPIETDNIFFRNEQQGNRAVVLTVLVTQGIFLLTLLLNLLGVFSGRALTIAATTGLLVQLIPLAVYAFYGPGKPWMKYVLLSSMVITMAILDAELTYMTALLMAIPVVISIRYFSTKTTFRVAVFTAVAFAVSAIWGATHGILDVNVIDIPQGTTLFIETRLVTALEDMGLSDSMLIRNTLLYRYIPRLFIFVIIAYASIQSAARSHKMILEQQYISRVDAELSMANEIQQSHLPDPRVISSERPDFDIYASMTPAREIGGDYYDFFMVDDDHLCLLIADVSDKGVPAALFMMSSQSLIKAEAMRGSSPSKVLETVNRALCENNPRSMFVTVWLGLLELSTGKLTYVNAGHEYPVIKHPGRAFQLFRDKHGLFVGAMDIVKYREYDLMLEPGSKLFVYTDGLAEAIGEEQEQFGLDRIVATLNKNPDGSPLELLDTMSKEVDSFVHGAEQFDDLTMLCLEYIGPHEN